MWILNVIPKQVWLVLSLAVTSVIMVGASYYKGIKKGTEEERVKWELREQKLINEGVSKGIADLSIKLQEALDFKRNGVEIISSLENNLDTAKDRADALQVKLDELLSTPPTICDAVPDDEFRLYQELFNQTKPE
jgi:hypothetical protein